MDAENVAINNHEETEADHDMYEQNFIEEVSASGINDIRKRKKNTEDRRRSISESRSRSRNNSSQRFGKKEPSSSGLSSTTTFSDEDSAHAENTIDDTSCNQDCVQNSNKIISTSTLDSLNRYGKYPQSDQAAAEDSADLINSNFEPIAQKTPTSDYFGNSEIDQPRTPRNQGIFRNLIARTDINLCIPEGKSINQAVSARLSDVNDSEFISFYDIKKDNFHSKVDSPKNAFTRQISCFLKGSLQRLKNSLSQYMDSSSSTVLNHKKTEKDHANKKTESHFFKRSNDFNSNQMTRGGSAFGLSANKLHFTQENYSISDNKRWYFKFILKIII